MNNRVKRIVYSENKIKGDSMFKLVINKKYDKLKNEFDKLNDKYKNVDLEEYEDLIRLKESLPLEILLRYNNSHSQESINLIYIDTVRLFEDCSSFYDRYGRKATFNCSTETKKILIGESLFKSEKNNKNNDQNYTLKFLGTEIVIDENIPFGKLLLK